LPPKSTGQSPSIPTPIDGSGHASSISSSILSVIPASVITSDVISVEKTTTAAAAVQTHSSSGSAIPSHSESSGVSVPRVVSETVGVIVTLILLVLLAFFFIRRRKRHNNRHDVLLSRGSDSPESGPYPFTGSPGNMSRCGQTARTEGTVSREWELGRTCSVLESSGNGYSDSLAAAGEKCCQDSSSPFRETSRDFILLPLSYSLPPSPTAGAPPHGPWRPPSLSRPRSEHEWI
jgi:hypothetical protein